MSWKLCLVKSAPRPSAALPPGIANSSREARALSTSIFEVVSLSTWCSTAGASTLAAFGLTR
ncbi:hypothetical protein [Rugamonas sp. DEMB1]|uniref:hypothetical protein n=1 Tax=Rugamonas sp. DEMB1 TaxID=3039386 RepID=UPI00244A2C6D|nr:hypothetical protein [Rugamonas sp. DEMB1]WGG53647.1 hypothetical protein QC826_23215 [Rugamonas sp. DEMB1]